MCIYSDVIIDWLIVVWWGHMAPDILVNIGPCDGLGGKLRGECLQNAKMATTLSWSQSQQTLWRVFVVLGVGWGVRGGGWLGEGLQN